MIRGMWDSLSDRDNERLETWICRCGAKFTMHGHTGMLSREVVCDDCGRAEASEYLRRRANAPTQDAA